MKQYQVWECKIGAEGPLQLPDGADLPMRMAIKKAFFEITGQHAEFCFSGWGAQLTENQRKVIEE